MAMEEKKTFKVHTKVKGKFQGRSERRRDI